jgi:hypothetical protein
VVLAEDGNGPRADLLELLVGQLLGGLETRHLFRDLGAKEGHAEDRRFLMLKDESPRDDDARGDPDSVEHERARGSPARRLRGL